MKLRSIFLSITLTSLALAPMAHARSNRLKELVTVQGVRTNDLTGFGLVVGLRGTGDNAQSPMVRKSMANMLRRLGIRLTSDQIKAKNVAAVLVTAKLPAFARGGQAIDVLVSSVGEAKSLQGGTLIGTPLKGPDGRTYALAQGALSLGGFAVEGASGSSKRKNHSTVGRIPSGAVVERSAPSRLTGDSVTLLLKEPDFTTASRIAKAINVALAKHVATVRDPGAVHVRLLGRWRQRHVHFIAVLEAVEAVPDAPARVIIDERTGTVVVGQHVRLGKAAIAHGALTVSIKEDEAPSQPGPLAVSGKTVLSRKTKIDVKEEKGDLKVLNQSATVGDVASALNALGAKPRDLVSIFQALRAAGALRADIQVL